MVKNGKIKVKIKLFATFRQVIKLNEVELLFESHPTVYDALISLCDQYPLLHNQIFNDNNEFKQWNHALINGRNIKFLEGLNTKLNHNDVLSVFPPVAGG
ncbi:MAG: ubiquitin-like small modifier protein 1 [Candidatus Hodarchaeales archaeon]